MAFVPRTNDDGMRDNPKWYSENPFYQAGFGLPNCTCYAWGRFWEVSDPANQGINKPTNLPTGDGGTWWERAVDSGYYETGQTPQLGAVICFYDDREGHAGHVAIVEAIEPRSGLITCSNSEYQGRYFFMSYIAPIDGKYDWGTHYKFQGFIYNPQVTPPTPVQAKKKKGFPWALYTNKIRERRS